MTFYRVDGNMCQNFVANSNATSIPLTEPFRQPMTLGHCDTAIYGEL
jgi:hypothetical protein